ncbi:MAG: TolC family outer membrane protein [Rhodospirillales bacterium]|nr:TolC family outer membrane protein [Alphaproteobacteria bacterium]MCB1840710.1 TolC family outer membrane protein [Alphaproteobacteria bacterium]MCB9977056.1 TolC family outer membrane protein [Rhodospirillales bacterium]
MKVMNLRDAVAVGLATNPQYGVVAASKRATDEELNQGEALFLPSLDVNADAGYEYSDDVGTRARTASGDNTEEMFRRQAGITLTQMLFDGFRAHYEVKRQEARVNSSANRVRETSELVGLSIVEAYLEVMRQRQLLLIARENVSDHVAILEQIQDGVNAGRSTQADLEQAKARLASARSVESSTRQALRNAEAHYRQEVSDPPVDLEFPVVPFDQLSADVEEEVVQAITNSPTLSIFESDIEVAYAEAQGTKSTMYPQVDLQLNARTGQDLGGVDGKDTSASALVVMNWNLYRGGADAARAREFVHRHQQSKEQRAEAARQVENDVRQTWAGMVAAGERATQFSAQAEANEEVVKAYKDQFNLDRRTLLDVLDAQNELFVSRSNTVNAEFLEMFAVYRLLALKGKLLPVLGVNYPRESELASSEEWSYKEKMDAR